MCHATHAVPCLLCDRHKKNLAGLVVLQPTPVLHTFFDFANLFLSSKVKVSRMKAMYDFGADPCF